MPEENDGGNGKRSLLGVIDPDAIKQKAADDLQALKKPTKTELYKSIFRVKHDDKPRSRTLGVLSNVFLHLHPAKINRDAVRYNYTWGMGGITFYLFVVLTWTGVLLMFYYHPTKVIAFRDILYLEHDVPFGKLLRNMHRWGAHAMVLTVQLHMFRVFLTGSYKKPRQFNWCVGVILLVLTLLLSFTGYLLPDDQLGFWAVTVGTNMARATPVLGHERSVRSRHGYDSVQRRALCFARRVDRRRQCAVKVLHLALHCDTGFRGDLHDRPFLAGPKGRRNLRSGAGDAGTRDQTDSQDLAVPANSGT